MLFPDSVCRAFADDIGAVFTCGETQGPILEQMFGEFGKSLTFTSMWTRLFVSLCGHAASRMLRDLSIDMSPSGTNSLLHRKVLT